MGRPKGSRNRLTQTFTNKGFRLLNKIMGKALKGDMDAAKLVLPFLPKPRAYTAPINVVIPEDAEPKEVAQHLIQAICAGDVDPMIGSKVIDSMFNASKFLEIDEVMGLLMAEIAKYEQDSRAGKRNH